MLLQNFTFGGYPSWNTEGTRLVWTATTASDGRVIAHGRQPVAAGAILQGDTGSLANISFTLPAFIATYDTVTVRAELELGEIAWATSWDLGVFPQDPVTICECKVPVFASLHILPAVKLQCSNAVPMPVPGELPKTPFLVVVGHDGINEATAAALNAAGGTAVLLNPSIPEASLSRSLPVYGGPDSIQAVANVDAFHQPWWSSPGSACSLAYNSTLVRDYMMLRGSFRRRQCCHSLNCQWLPFC